MTLKIRDPLTDYQPESQHFVEVGGYPLEAGKKWQVIDVRPDFDKRDFFDSWLME